MELHTFIASTEVLFSVIELPCPWFSVRGPPPLVENRGAIDEMIDCSINTSTR